MNRREKILAVTIGAFVVVFVGYLIVDNLLLGPAAKLDARAADLQREIALEQARFNRGGGYTDDLTRWASRTLSGPANEVSTAMRARLIALLNRAELGGGTIQPVGARTVRDVYEEIAWTVSVEGELARLVDLLYLLDSEPYLHRIENLEVRPDSSGGRCRLQLRYATISMLDKYADEGIPATRAAESQPSTDLETPLRDKYRMIARRDLFRPYVPRPPSPPPPPQPERNETPVEPQDPPPPPPPPEARFRVVALPQWGGAAEVFVLDTANRTTRRYEPGDTLAGGEIVRVDYRAMPMPDKPEILSPSRVIVKAGRDYFAVELGHNLAQKHRLTGEQLPEDIAGGE